MAVGGTRRPTEPTALGGTPMSVAQVVLAQRRAAPLVTTTHLTLPTPRPPPFFGPRVVTSTLQLATAPDAEGGVG